MSGEYGRQLYEIIGKIHRFSHEFKPAFNISKGEFMMLCTIEKKIEENRKEDDNVLSVSVSEINKFKGTSKAATSKMLSNLEDKKYIERIIDKKDKRVIYIKMTEEGSGILERIKIQFDQFIEDILQKLGDRDTKELSRILNRLYQILREETI